MVRGSDFFQGKISQLISSYKIPDGLKSKYKRVQIIKNMKSLRWIFTLVEESFSDLALKTKDGKQNNKILLL